jgi:tungstate transport system permease protein
MDLIVEAFEEAWRLLTTGDQDVYGITFRTLTITGASTLVATAIGVPVGLVLALARFPGQRLLVAFSYAGMGMPPVVAGLIVAILLWRSGPLGQLGLMYTPGAMVIAQALIATPLIVAVTSTGVMALPPALRLQVRAMGANDAQYLWLVAREARLPLLVAVMAGFGAVVSEVGASTVVGGNLSGETRVLTTAAVLEMSKGNFGTALALGFILLAIVLAVGVTVAALLHRMRRI